MGKYLFSNMNRAYLFALMLLFVPLTGCIESDDPSDNDSMELEEAVNDFVNALSAYDSKKICKYMGYEIDYEANIITLFNNSEIDKCIEEFSAENISAENMDYEYKITTSNYTEENREYRASNNSGFVYAVNVDIENCIREDEFEPWECEQNEEMFLWVEVNGQWIWHYQGLDLGESAPIVTFYVEKSSGGYWLVEVIKVSKEDDLTKFSFFLKDDSGSTHVGGNGFGEVAMQMISGEEHGIEVSYNGDDQQLQSRSDNISADDGSDYPVHFADNDRDGKLTAGDQFTVYGQGNSANGPAESDWKLDIQFDASGDIIGSAKLRD